jgi:hypothetical protein
MASKSFHCTETAWLKDLFVSRYITRNDRSPVMRALSTWRDTALRQQHEKPAYSPLFPLDSDSRDSADPSLPPSPPSTDLQEQSHDRQHHTRSKSEPPEKPAGKRTSSWAQWWSRGRHAKPSVSDDKDLNDTTKVSLERPVLRERASEPVQDVSVCYESHVLSELTVRQPQEPFMNRAPGEIEALETRIVQDIPHAESAPALPSTPVQLPVKEAIAVSTPNSLEEPMGKRKFAKTLRLTSEQLVCRACYMCGNITESIWLTMQSESAKPEARFKHHHLFTFRLWSDRLHCSHLRMGLVRLCRRVGHRWDDNKVGNLRLPISLRICQYIRDIDATLSTPDLMGWVTSLL